MPPVPPLLHDELRLLIQHSPKHTPTQHSTSQLPPLCLSCRCVSMELRCQAIGLRAERVPPLHSATLTSLAISDTQQNHHGRSMAAWNAQGAIARCPWL